MSQPLHDPPLGESDTRAKLITPGIHARGWTEDFIRREETAGAIELVNDVARRRSRGIVDYTLRLNVKGGSQPVAVALIEAKAESLPPGHGLDQAKGYARCKRMNVPFVFSSNGHMFVEFDRFTGLTSAAKPLSEFPAPAEIQTRYEKGMGFELEDEAARPLLTPYDGGESVRRYYQDAAIRAVFEKVAKAQETGQPKRALLTLATGSGKTFIAVQLLKRIADAGQLGRALFVCDRDELRTQGLAALQNVYGNEAAEISTGNPQLNARVVVATYQTLDVDQEGADASFLLKHYPENYFTHIIIDECHRSAWGTWSTVLTRNPNAVQVGLTATPRELDLGDDCGADAKRDMQITADNVKYFGEPVYNYSITQGMEDGYLALCKIQKGRVNLDNTGITIADIIARNPTDARTGRPITVNELQALYEKNTYEKKVLLPDRVQAMCADLFNYLCATGTHGFPEQKTIIFCARDSHADDVAIEMNNLYARWCAANGRPPLDAFAFKCTSAHGKDDLKSLKGQARSHFIATTVDLLTTGVDVPSLRNVVFFRYITSTIVFYQMVGRGTRIDPATGKLMFHLYDYTNATDLFGARFITKPAAPGPGGGSTGPIPPPSPLVRVTGFNVVVNDAGIMILAEVDGVEMPITIQTYKQQLAQRLLVQVANINDFRHLWILPSDRRELFGKLPDAGRSPMLIQQLEHKQDYDLYDVLAEIGYGLAPRTRTQRAEAFQYKHAAWLSGLPKTSADVLGAIVGQFAIAGTDGIENRSIFEIADIKKAAGPKGPIDALRAVGKPVDVLMDTKARLFSA